MGLLTTLEKKKLDHPKKNTWTPLITIEPIKNKIQPLQKKFPLNVEKKKIARNVIFTIFSYKILNNKLLLINTK